jgi:hypothetical protein
MLIDVLREDRRLVILLCLTEVPAAQLNEDVVRQAVTRVGHQVDRTDVRADVQWLEQHGLVRVEHLPMPSGELWLVHLTSSGDAVAKGKPHVGVARPPLR